MQKIVIILFVLCFSGMELLAQEKGVIVNSSGEKTKDFLFFVKGLDQPAEAQAVQLAFSQKEGIISCMPEYKSGKVHVTGMNHISIRDIRDIVSFAGFEIDESKEKQKQLLTQ